MSEKYVLTLIAAPGQAKLDETLLGAARRAVESTGGKITGADWLAEGEAADLFFHHSAPENGENAARELLSGQAIDLITQSAYDRKKRVLVSDMDSTMITVECIDELADFAGLKPQVAAITERAMNGELDFKAALTERVALLRGLPESVLEEAYVKRVRFMPGAKQLVATMRANGAHCLLVSGGFTYFTAQVREELGFHEDHANRLGIQDGSLTGEVIPPILDKDSKLQSLIAACQARGISLSDSLAIGDGANDLPMLLAAGLGVAYHAKPNVRASARAQVNHCDLTALLYAQGYRKEEFRT